MKNNIVRGVVTSACAGVLAVATAVASPGCSSPAPAGSAPPASAAPTSAAPGGGAAAAPPVEPATTPTASTSPAPASASPPAATAPSPAATIPAPPPPAPPRTYKLSAGRPIAVYTSSTLSTKTNEPGEKFVATLAEPIVDGDWVIAGKGARVEGVIVDADPGKRVKGVASITVTLESLTLADGRTLKLSASQVRRQAKSTKGKDAKKIGIGAGIGAAIGAIAGGGDGAAIGAGVGGGAGTAAVLATRGDPAVIPAETRLGFTLRSAVTITDRRAPR